MVFWPCGCFLWWCRLFASVGALFDYFLLFHFACLLVWCFWFGVFLSNKRSLFQSGAGELPKQSKN